MARLLPAAFVLFLVGLATYAGSFYATRSALAHYSHCDEASPWTFNPCNDVPGGVIRYYAGQRGNNAYPNGFSNGIEGFISAQDVSLHDTTKQDFIADWVGVKNVTTDDEWVQLGFTEGILPMGWRTSPRVYNETVSACYGYSFAERSTPAPNPRYNEYFRVSWAGATGSGCGHTIYIWQYGRGPSFTTFDYGFMYVSSGRFRATTEGQDAHGASWDSVFWLDNVLYDVRWIRPVPMDPGWWILVSMAGLGPNHHRREPASPGLDFQVLP